MIPHNLLARLTKPCRSSNPLVRGGTGQDRGTEGTGLHCIPPQQFIFWETVVDILQLCCSNLWWTAFKCYCWPATAAEMLEPDSRGSVGLVSLIWLANPIPGSLVSGASGCSPQSGKCQVNFIHLSIQPNQWTLICNLEWLGGRRQQMKTELQMVQNCSRLK